MAVSLPQAPKASFRRYFNKTLLTLAVIFVGASPAYPWGVQWRDVTPEEMAMTEPQIDPEAGAEILLRELKVDDLDPKKTTFENYMRIKIFDQRGVDELNPIDIEVFEKRRITDIAARVIKPDGTITYLDPKDVYSREVYRRNDTRFRASSFSLPALEPGCIIEYQWEERFYNGSASGTQFLLLSKFPIHQARFRIRPYPGIRMLSSYFGLGENALKEERGGWKLLEASNLPALPDEAYLPPIYNIQPWVMVVYTGDTGKEFEPVNYWKERSRELYDYDRRHVKPKQRLVKQKAEELTAGWATDEERLRAIYDFCTRNIKNLASNTSGYSAADIDKLKDNADPDDTIKNSYGWPKDINQLFASLAKAAGFDACLARCNRKNIAQFDQRAISWLAVPDLIVMVVIDDQAIFFDPGEPHIPYGRLYWINERAPVLIPNRKESEFRVTGGSGIDYNAVNREAHLKIDEAGDLTGVVKLIYGGHNGVSMKNRYDGLAPKERRERIANQIAEGLPRVELYNIEFHNIDERERPFEVTFEVKVPGYGEGTGRRIFFEPSFFEKGRKALFTREKRELDLHFPFPWTRNDTVWIEYPEGWELEEAAAPRSVIDTDGISHVVTLGATKVGNKLRYTRYEKQAMNQVPASVYPALKELYEAINEQDHHMVTIRKLEEPAKQEEAAPEDNSTASK